VPTTIGTSDLTGSMSAAFAAASLAFQNVDKPYAQVLPRDLGGVQGSGTCACVPGGVCLLHPLHPEVAWRPLASMQLKYSSLAEGIQQRSLTGVSALNHNGILLQGLLNLAANMYKAAKAYPGSYSVRIRGSVCTTQVHLGLVW
jgi:hypothetical protein